MGRVGTYYRATTWSPGLTFVTPSPTDSTMPAPSWPRMMGKAPSGSLPERVYASVELVQPRFSVMQHDSKQGQSFARDRGTGFRLASLDIEASQASKHSTHPVVHQEVPARLPATISALAPGRRSHLCGRRQCSISLSGLHGPSGARLRRLRSRGPCRPPRPQQPDRLVN